MVTQFIDVRALRAVLHKERSINDRLHSVISEMPCQFQLFPRLSKFSTVPWRQAMHLHPIRV